MQGNLWTKVRLSDSPTQIPSCTHLHSNLPNSAKSKHPTFSGGRRKKRNNSTYTKESPNHGYRSQISKSKQMPTKRKKRYCLGFYNGCIVTSNPGFQFSLFTTMILILVSEPGNDVISSRNFHYSGIMKKKRKQFDSKATVSVAAWCMEGLKTDDLFRHCVCFHCILSFLCFNT